MLMCVRAVNTRSQFKDQHLPSKAWVPSLEGVCTDQVNSMVMILDSGQETQCRGQSEGLGSDV